MDGQKATASGDGLKKVPANRPAHFNVDTHGVGEARLDVVIQGLRGLSVPARVTGSPETGYHVEYTPTEIGGWSLFGFCREYRII